MIDTYHARDVESRTRRPVTGPEQDPRRRLQVAAIRKLHLTVDGRSLCGLVTACELDLYSDEAALRAWNTGPLEQCAQCATALVTRIRQPARTDLRTPDGRTGHREHPGPAHPYQPIHEQLA